MVVRKIRISTLFTFMVLQNIIKERPECYKEIILDPRVQAWLRGEASREISDWCRWPKHPGQGCEVIE